MANNTTRSTFPYEYLDLDPPDVMFNRLVDYKSNISNRPFRLNLDNTDPRFQGKYYSVQSDEKVEKTIDNISSHYTEEVRVTAKISSSSFSPFEYWKRHEDDLIQESLDTGKSFPDIFWGRRILKASIFKPTWMRFLFDVLYPNQDKAGLKMLDPSAGWGDRLIAAISMGITYVGYDPNVDLMEGHSRIIYDLANNDTENYKVFYEPFETSVVYTPENENKEWYDIVFTSPPFFDFEIYSDSDTQSTSRYKRYGDWKTNFLFASLRKAYEVLKQNGYMAIHISNIRSYRIADDVINFISNDLGMKYMGVVGIAGWNPKYNPIWIWKKETSKPRFAYKPKQRFQRK